MYVLNIGNFDKCELHSDEWYTFIKLISPNTSSIVIYTSLSEKTVSKIVAGNGNIEKIRFPDDLITYYHAFKLLPLKQAFWELLAHFDFHPDSGIFHILFYSSDEICLADISINDEQNFVVITKQFERKKIEQHFRIGQEKPGYFNKWESILEEVTGNCDLKYLALRHPG